MYEVDYIGWVRTPEELHRIKVDFNYRRKLHFKSLYKALIYKRWNYFTCLNIKGLMFNEIKQF